MWLGLEESEGSAASYTENREPKWRSKSDVATEKLENLELELELEH